jgi:hypothetical protein
MKIKTILTSTLMLALTALNAQTKPSTTKPTIVNNQCDELKKENEFLKKTLSINEPIKTYADNNIEIKLVSAKGNIKTQKITIEYLITNKIQIRNFKIDANIEQIVSMSGDIIPLTKGYSVFDVELNTDIPIKTALEIGTILPENTIIKFLTMKYLLYKSGTTFYGWTPTGVAEFKDIPVTWK